MNRSGADRHDRGIITERFELRTEGREAGYYTDDRIGVVGFARTPGYETYEGLGWYGAIVQAAAQQKSEPRAGAEVE